MNRVYSKWDKFELPQLTERDYGIPWPKGTTQLTREFLCFLACRRGTNTPGMQPALIHFLNINRLLYPTMVELYKDVPKGRVWNNYFLDVAEILTDFNGSCQDRTLLTGPASANKTYTVASYVFTSWMAAPDKTLAMVSTTSGSASERRIWADIKDFHREGKYEENGIPQIGKVIEYLKAIVFDEGKELGGSDSNQRDFRNGLQVIAIANDSTGAAALNTIQGSKNEYVIWALDEMAQMNPGVTRPNGNLGKNPHYHFIGIGNANDANDPHAQDCMPLGGLEALDVNVDRRWTSATGKDVLFLHGEESPNNHPFVDQSNIKKANDYPFPYAANRMTSEISAKEYGHGNIEEGKNSTDYWKFDIGFWAPAAAASSLYTKNIFISYNAHIPPDIIVEGKRTFGAGDFAFSAGGDSNTFMESHFGFNSKGDKRIILPSETTIIRSHATNKDDFYKGIAKQYVERIQSLKIDYKDFGGDTGNDASLIMNEMSRLAGTYDLKGISSVGEAVNKKKYQNKVTELWFTVRDVIKTGLIRGVNFQSRYYSELIKRKYSAIGRNSFVIERKRDMKKRMGKSPDNADVFIYNLYMVAQSGLIDEELVAAREILSSEDVYEKEQEGGRMRRLELYPNQQKEEEFQLTETFDGDGDFGYSFL